MITERPAARPSALPTAPTAPAAPATPATPATPTLARALAPIAFDDEGFLVDPSSWTTVLACQIALVEGVSALTPKHWQVIEIVRERYFRLGALPVMRLVCRAAQVDPHDAHRLFRSCRCLWRIAGLPDPGPEARAYMN